MKKDQVIKIIFSVFLVFLINKKLYCQETFDPVKDLPKEINVRYGTDVVPDEETALLISEIYLKKRYLNVKFKKSKPFEIKLIADDKVWEIKVIQKTFTFKHSEFYIRINKNTGEVLNFWAER